MRINKFRNGRKIRLAISSVFLVCIEILPEMGDIMPGMGMKSDLKPNPHPEVLKKYPPPKSILHLAPYMFQI
jgi:hypothetical protein